MPYPGLPRILVRGLPGTTAEFSNESDPTYRPRSSTDRRSGTIQVRKFADPEPMGSPGSRSIRQSLLLRGPAAQIAHRKAMLAPTFTMFARDITPKYNVIGHAFGGALLWPRNVSNGR
jgi:hypothetical protein